MLKLAVFADGCRLAVALRLGSLHPQRRNSLFREHLAEFLADRNQGREVFNVFSRKRIFDYGNRRGPPGWRADGLSHLQPGFLDDRDDLANDRAHLCLPSLMSMISRMHRAFACTLANP